MSDYTSFLDEKGGLKLQLELIGTLYHVCCYYVVNKGVVYNHEYIYIVQITNIISDLEQ